MLVQFTKMHGLGNDFVVMELLTQQITLRAAQIKRMMDRHLGIGGDQLLLIEPPTRPNADFYYRIFNANGHEVEQCGNGARCAARFFYDMAFTNKRHLEADCLAGPLHCIIEKNGLVTIHMGIPKFHPAEIPILTDKEALLYPLNIDHHSLSISALSIGNPHAVLQVPDIETTPVKKLGSLLSKHAFFPKETNVEFMEVIDKHAIRLKVYERGVGETLACGSGACAAVVAGIRLELLQSPVKAIFPRGTLHISWEGAHKPVCMSGPTNSVFVGRLLL